MNSLLQFNDFASAHTYTYDDSSMLDDDSIATDNVLLPKSADEESISYELEDSNLMSDVFTLDKNCFENAKAYAERMEEGVAFDYDDLDDTSSTSSFRISEASFMTEIDDNDSILLESNLQPEKSLTACVLVDIINGEIRTCNNITTNQWPLSQLLDW